MPFSCDYMHNIACHIAPHYLNIYIQQIEKGPLQFLIKSSISKLIDSFFMVGSINIYKK